MRYPIHTVYLGIGCMTSMEEKKKNGQRSHSHGGMFGSNDSPPMIFLASSLQFSGVNSAEKFHDISIHQHHFF